MRSQVRIVLMTLLVGAAVAASSHVQEALASMETFRVTEVEITGLDHLQRGDVLKLMGVTRSTSIWGDPDDWALALEEHPLLKDVQVSRRMPGTLVVQLSERVPVALVPTPTLEPVDADGMRLPVEPGERRLDLPIIHTVARPAPGIRLLPSRARALAAEVARLQSAEPRFLQMVSEVAWYDEGTLVARWSEPHVDFLLRLGAHPRRLREGLTVLADALGREPDDAPTVIDLRYADQVVVRRTR